MAGRDEEDILGEQVASEEEGEGEDLYGDDMAQDYVDDPENDQYDPEMLDDTEGHELNIEHRMAAEAAMNARDRRRRGREASSPLMPSPGPSDLEASPDAGRRLRRRIDEAMSPAPSSYQGEGTADDDDDEGDVPDAYYELINEQWEPKMEASMDARLEKKIRICFRQFLRKYPRDSKDKFYPELLDKMAEDYLMHLEVSIDHLQSWSARLVMWLMEDPKVILPLLNRTLMDEAAKRYSTYKDLKNIREIDELRVALKDVPISTNIRDLGTQALNQLVKVHGVVTKRSNVFNQVKRLWLNCAKCSLIAGPFEVEQDKQLRPGRCLDCQSSGPWRVNREKSLYRNHQKITLQESPGGVDPGKMPRSKDVVLSGSLADSVRPGDEVILTAVYKCIYDAATNARTCFPVYRTELEAVQVERKGDMKIAHITDEQTAQILELARSPNIRERIIASIAPSIYGMEYVKTALAMSMFGGQQKTSAGKHRIRGDINTLIVGDPGLAKSQFLKYVEQTFPKAVYTSGKGASAVGLTAAVTRGENGDFNLEGGAMVLADDGICLIDEFDKMNDQDRTSIHEAMEQQSISISKAGIVATLQARCAVVAVANPTEGRYDPQQTFASNVGLTDPILSRFDMLCVLRDEADAVKDQRLADHVVCSHIRSHPEASGDELRTKPKLQLQSKSTIEPISQELLQKYIIFARKRIAPQMLDVDGEKVAQFYKDIRAEAFQNGGAPMTARHVESIIRIAEANARMELRTHVSKKDLDNAIATMLESFIQSQKHQVAEELRKRFRRYIVSATPMADQIMNVLEKLFKEKYEALRLTRPRELPPDVSEVPVPMQEVVKAVQRNDIDIEEAYTFFSTDRFKNCFREEGGKLYRAD